MTERAHTPFVLRASLRQGAFELAVDAAFAASAAAIVGPSGAGKTTLLEVIAGIRQPSAGCIQFATHVLFDSSRGVNVPAHRRRIGYVPQDIALFPHLTVRRNILYGARARQDPARVLSILDIDDIWAREDVVSLSGGERQRVAIARALMSDPRLLLLDEPLAAVDVALRDRILGYLRRIRDEIAVPMLYVTHNAGEASAIADHVLRLEGGRVVEA
jgi:molybdate transport system ATP-binding protein